MCKTRNFNEQKVTDKKCDCDTGQEVLDIPRQELFITTKVPCCLPKLSNPYCTRFDKNNALLNITYTDIMLLLHHPCLDDEDTIKPNQTVYVQLQE